MISGPHGQDARATFPKTSAAPVKSFAETALTDGFYSRKPHSAYDSGSWSS